MSEAVPANEPAKTAAERHAEELPEAVAADASKTEATVGGAEQREGNAACGEGKKDVDMEESADMTDRNRRTAELPPTEPKPEGEGKRQEPDGELLQQQAEEMQREPADKPSHAKPKPQVAEDQGVSAKPGEGKRGSSVVDRSEKEKTSRARKRPKLNSSGSDDGWAVNRASSQAAASGDWGPEAGAEKPSESESDGPVLPQRTTRKRLRKSQEGAPKARTKQGKAAGAVAANQRAGREAIGASSTPGCGAGSGEREAKRPGAFRVAEPKDQKGSKEGREAKARKQAGQTPKEAAKGHKESTDPRDAKPAGKPSPPGVQADAAPRPAPESAGQTAAPRE